MSIQFKCVKCGKQHRVSSKYAGRSAKCKCGKSMTVPSPEAYPSGSSPVATAPLVTAELIDTVEVVEEVTEAQPSAFVDSLPEFGAADFPAMQSPAEPSPLAGTSGPVQGGAPGGGFYSPYAPPTVEPKPPVQNKKRKPASERPPVSIGMAIVSILLTLSGLGYFAFGGFILSSAELQSSLQKVGIAAAFFVPLAFINGVVCLAGGIGVAMKRTWGWCATGAFAIFSVLDRVIAHVGGIINGSASALAFFSLVISVLLALYVFTPDARKAFAPTMNEIYAALGGGLVLGVIIFALAIALA